MSSVKPSHSYKVLLASLELLYCCSVIWSVYSDPDSCDVTDRSQNGEEVKKLADQLYGLLTESPLPQAPLRDSSNTQLPRYNLCKSCSSCLLMLSHDPGLWRLLLSVFLRDTDLLLCLVFALNCALCQSEQYQIEKVCMHTCTVGLKNQVARVILRVKPFCLKICDEQIFVCLLSRLSVYLSCV